MRGFPFVFGTAIFLASACAFAQAPAPPLPAMSELREQFKAAKYQDVLKTIPRLLALKGEAAKPYDRYELFRLRGECLLRTKSMSPAADAFDDVAEIAKGDASREGSAEGVAVLIRRSKQLGYTRRPAEAEKGRTAPTPKPMPIVEEAERKSALAALLADERAIVQPRLDVAERSNQLPPIIEAGRMLADLWAIEVASTGKGEQTKAMTKDLADHSHDLIATALDAMNDNLEGAFAHASTESYDQDEDGRRYYRGRLGLHGDDRATSQFVMRQSELLAPAAAELWKVTQFDKLKGDAEIAVNLYNRAVYVLEYPYNERRASRTQAGPAAKAR